MKSKIARGLLLLTLTAATFGLAASGSVAQDVPTPVARPTTAPTPKPVTAVPSAKTAPAANASGIGTTKPAVLPPITTPVVAVPYGQVYLQRGLINVFSRGMDQIAAKLQQRGISVVVFNHSYWPRYADEAIARYKTSKAILPIIIVGHSLGADGAVLMANYFGLHNVPVRLVIAFDGVIQKEPVGANVEELINYYKPDEYGQIVKTSPRFHGTITNIDLTKFADIDHLNIDKIEELQDEVILKILDVLKKKPKVASSSG
jgi:hypothetical protein